jgi:hypothetical protein
MPAANASPSVWHRSRSYDNIRQPDKPTSVVCRHLRSNAPAPRSGLFPGFVGRHRTQASGSQQHHLISVGRANRRASQNPTAADMASFLLAISPSARS